MRISKIELEKKKIFSLNLFVISLTCRFGPNLKADGNIFILTRPVKISTVKSKHNNAKKEHKRPKKIDVHSFYHKTRKH